MTTWLHRTQDLRRPSWQHRPGAVAQGSATARFHPQPHSTVIAESNRSDAPFDRFETFQVQPVELQWQTKDSKRRRRVDERRVIADGFEQLPDGCSLALQKGQRPHRPDPAHVYRVEIAADE